jgi:hypothetical protein
MHMGLSGGKREGFEPVVYYEKPCTSSTKGVKRMAVSWHQIPEDVSSGRRHRREPVYRKKPLGGKPYNSGDKKGLSNALRARNSITITGRSEE